MDQATSSSFTKDVGISSVVFHRWLEEADEEDGPPSPSAKEELIELREAGKRIKPLEQEAGVRRRAVAYLFRDVNPK